MLYTLYKKKHNSIKNPLAQLGYHCPVIQIQNKFDWMKPFSITCRNSLVYFMPLQDQENINVGLPYLETKDETKLDVSI